MTTEGIIMKTTNKMALTVASLLFVAPAISFAGDKNPWTDCGIGAMIFDETPAAAAISNIIWDLGTTAVTSAGTSENTCEGKDVAAASFITETYASIEEETVKGEGEHLNAMLEIMGCESAAHSAIINSVRADFTQSLQAASYTDQSSVEKAQQYYNIMQNQITANYSQQCKA